MKVEQLLQKGIELHTSGQLAEAEKIYRSILGAHPDHPDAIHFMGVLAYNVGKNDIAVDYLEKAISLNPGNPGCYNNLGNVYQQQGEYASAVPHYEKTIQLDPGHHKALNNLGVAYLRLGKLEKAGQSLESALALNPAYAEAHNNLGEVYYAMARYDKALNAYEISISISEEFVQAHWNRSLAMLLTGDFKNGWAEYEWRWKRPETPVRQFACGKPWQGENIDGKVLFVYEEQGLGDTIQFMRYLPLLKNLGAKVVFETLPPMIRLTTQTDGYDRLMVGKKGVDTRPVDRFDFFVPMMSLPLRFGTELDTVPSAIPYLKPDPDLSGIWRARMGEADAFRVGVVWSGSPLHRNDQNRSVHLSRFAGLADIRGIEWVSLQKETCEKWTDIDPDSFFTMNPGGQLSDFADTAAVIDNLDLVISVDTAVVHLAGAMGKKVWTLLPSPPDWRWLTDRKDSPWYPSMTLFRQPSNGDWDAVFDNIKACLFAELEKKI
ncbi:MAG: tetratricopeptide repeat-containing glycosyltransferase family protein [Desulfobacterales bacterium]|nr:tetratricopeptide repeat-containing glycosyltransferase family protein [Desulfobacterales bacterium]